jgi:hypothetical protein
MAAAAHIFHSMSEALFKTGDAKAKPRFALASVLNQTA